MELKFENRPSPDTEGWHEIHDFMQGWGWHYKKGEEEYYVFQRDLGKKFTKNGHFTELPQWRKIALAKDIDKQKEQDRIEWQRKREERGPIDKIAIPMIRQQFSELKAEDLVGIQPMTGNNSNKLKGENDV